MLLPFLDNVYETLSADDQLRYQRLLECEDQDIFAWLMHRQDPEDLELQRIVQIVREHNKKPDEP